MTTLQLPRSQSEERPNVLSMPESVERPLVDESRIAFDAANYAVASDRHYDEAVEMVRLGYQRSMKREGQANGQARVAEVVDSALDDDDAATQINDAITQLREIETVRRFLPPSLQAAVEANAPGARSMALDRIARLQYTGQRISETMEDFGWNETTALDFAEVFVDPLSITRVPIYRRLTEQFEDLLSPSVSNEQFEEGLENIIGEAIDAGWMSEENLIHLATFLDFLGSGAYSNQARAEVALGWMDVGLSALGAASSGVVRGVSGSLRGSTSITTGVVSRGPSGAVVDAARNDIHGLELLQPGARRNEVIQDRIEESVLLDEIESAGVSRPSILTPTTLRHAFYTAPQHTAAREFEMTSEALRVFSQSAGSTGSAFDDATFQAFRTQFARDRFRYLHTSSNGNTRAIDVDVGVDDYNNVFWIEVLGRTNGTPFSANPRGLAAARRAAREGDDIMQQADGSYVILRRGNVNPENFSWLADEGYSTDLEGFMLWRATDPEQISEGFWARWGSPLAQADKNTSWQLFRGESVLARQMDTLVNHYQRTIRGMSARSIGEVYPVFDHMAGNNSPRAYTREQFTDWFISVYNREPTDRQVNLYTTQQELLDAQVFSNANDAYVSAVRMNGIILSENGIDLVVRPVRRQDIDPNAQIFDPESQELRSLSDIDEGERIYENIGANGIPNNALYTLANGMESRAVRHSDFFIRNSGGHRGYVVNAMQFLAKQERSSTYAGGITRTENPVTLFGARTAEEANRGVDEVNTILDAIHEILPVGGRSMDEYNEAVAALGTNRRLDELVTRNTSWAPDIENAADFVARLESRGIDLRTRFRVVPEGEALRGMSTNVFNSFARTQGELTRLQVAQRGGRANQALPLYGGGTVPQRSVEEVLQGSYISTLAQNAENSYLLRAGHGLIEAAKEQGVIPAYNDIRHLPLRTQIRRIVEDRMIDVSGATGSSPNFGRRLMLDAQRLDFRLSRTSPATRIWRGIVRNLANFLYRKGFRGMAGRVDRLSTDPVSALRGFAFNAYLGFYNIGQLLMQSVQVVNIVGIAGTRGIVGAALYPSVRFAIANGNPNVIRRTGELLSKVTGQSADEFVDMVEMLRSSGRTIADVNIAELSVYEDAAFSFGNFRNNQVMRTMGRVTRNTLRGGRVFFKEGELAARITAFNTAYMEAVQKLGPRTAANSNDFMAHVTWREQVLTQGMSAASRQAYEQLPFMQFMTYQLRINEAIFAGTFSGNKSVLTNAERTRLAFTHFAMFGAMATTPTALLSQWYLSRNDVDLPEEVVRGFQRGGLDAALSYLTESETAASTRFSSSMGLYNLYTGLQNDGGMFFAGPGVNLAIDTGRSMLGVITQGTRAIATGETAGFEASLTDFARIASSTNNAFNAFTAARYSTFLTRRNQVVTNNIDGGISSDAVFLAFGVPLDEVASTYEYMAMSSFRRRWLRDYANRITRTHRIAHDAVRRDDIEAAEQTYRVLGEMYSILSPVEREQVDRMVDDSARALDDELMLQVFRNQSEIFDRMTRE
jgi:hypothetical protein